MFEDRVTEKLIKRTTDDRDQLAAKMQGITTYLDDL